MQNIKGTFLIPFLAISLLHLIGVSQGTDNALVFFTKPLLMPLLALWFWKASPTMENNIRIPIFGALAFSFLGDTALLFVKKQELWFLLGLGFFLIAHIFYILAFSRLVSFRDGFLKKNPWAALPILLYLIGFLYSLWGSLQDASMELPVVVYAVVITLMLLSALNLMGHIPKIMARSVLVGAVLFVFSDSLIAIKKFISPYGPFDLPIMVLYLVGQFCMVYGIVSLFGKEETVVVELEEF